MSWPYDGWSNNMPIYVPGGASAKTNYAIVNFTIPYLRGMNADFSDCRFTDAEGNALEYNREGYTSGSTSKFSIMLPSHPTDGQIIYLFWGNSSATDASNPSAVYDRQITNCEGAWDARFGSSTSLPDRSGNGNDPTVFTDVTWDGEKFTGTSPSAAISVPDADELDMGTDDWSMVFIGSFNNNTAYNYAFKKVGVNNTYWMQAGALSDINVRVVFNSNSIYSRKTGDYNDSIKRAYIATIDRDGNENIYANNVQGTPSDVSAHSSVDVSSSVALDLLSRFATLYRSYLFRKVLTSDERNDLSDPDKYPYATPDIPHTVNIVAARDDDIAPYFLESTFYTHDNRGFKPPFGARLRRDFPWPRWPVLAMLFNEGSGDTVLDLSGNGNHGTIHGGCTWEEGGLKFSNNPFGGAYVDCGQHSSLDVLADSKNACFIIIAKAVANGGYYLTSHASEGDQGWNINDYVTGVVYPRCKVTNAGGTERGLYGYASNITPEQLMVHVQNYRQNDGKLDFYLNGSLSRTVSLVADNYAITDSVKIGLITTCLVQTIIIIPAALDSGLIKYLSAFPFSEQVWEWGNLPF